MKLSRHAGEAAELSVRISKVLHGHTGQRATYALMLSLSLCLESYPGPTPLPEELESVKVAINTAIRMIINTRKRKTADGAKLHNMRPDARP
jgi:hypothetical protein